MDFYQHTPPGASTATAQTVASHYISWANAHRNPQVDPDGFSLRDIAPWHPSLPENAFDQPDEWEGLSREEIIERINQQESANSQKAYVQAVLKNMVPDAS